MSGDFEAVPRARRFCHEHSVAEALGMIEGTGLVEQHDDRVQAQPL